MPQLPQLYNGGNVSTRGTENLYLSHQRPCLTLMETRRACQPLSAEEGPAARPQLPFYQVEAREEPGSQLKW